ALELSFVEDVCRGGNGVTACCSDRGRYLLSLVGAPAQDGHLGPRQRQAAGHDATENARRPRQHTDLACQTEVRAIRTCFTHRFPLRSLLTLCPALVEPQGRWERSGTCRTGRRPGCRHRYAAPRATWQRPSFPAHPDVRVVARGCATREGRPKDRTV